MLRRMIAAYSSAVPVRRLLEAIFGTSLATWICEKCPSGVKMRRPFGVSPNGNDFLPSGAVTSATTNVQVPMSWSLRLLACCATAAWPDASSRHVAAIETSFILSSRGGRLACVVRRGAPAPARQDTSMVAAPSILATSEGDVAGHQEQACWNVRWLLRALRGQFDPGQRHADSRQHLREQLAEEATEMLSVAVKRDDDIGRPVAPGIERLAEFGLRQQRRIDRGSDHRDLRTARLEDVAEGEGITGDAAGRLHATVQKQNVAPGNLAGADLDAVREQSAKVIPVDDEQVARRLAREIDQPQDRIDDDIRIV